MRKVRGIRLTPVKKWELAPAFTGQIFDILPYWPVPVPIFSQSLTPLEEL
jgi:hypothetical protein